MFVSIPAKDAGGLSEHPCSPEERAKATLVVILLLNAFFGALGFGVLSSTAVVVAGTQGRIILLVMLLHFPLKQGVLT